MYQFTLNITVSPALTGTQTGPRLLRAPCSDWDTEEGTPEGCLLCMHKLTKELRTNRTSANPVLEKCPREQTAAAETCHTLSFLILRKKRQGQRGQASSAVPAGDSGKYCSTPVGIPPSSASTPLRSSGPL